MDNFLWLNEFTLQSEHPMTTSLLFRQQRPSTATFSTHTSSSTGPQSTHLLTQTHTPGAHLHLHTPLNVGRHYAHKPRPS